MERRHWELGQLLKTIERKLGDEAMRSSVVKKVAGYVKSAEKPKRETLDRLALLVGFQDWESFRTTLYGDTDGQLNFGEKLDHTDSTTPKSIVNRSDDASSHN